MAAILVVEDHELKLILRALNQYKDTIFPEDDLNNEKGQTRKIIDRIRKTTNQKHKGGKEL